jgi:hypothetical protein
LYFHISRGNGSIRYKILLVSSPFPLQFFKKRIPVEITNRYFVRFDEHIVVVERINPFPVHDIRAVDAQEPVGGEQFLHVFQARRCDSLEF